ncbi:MAG: MFS transporter [archaeon]
MKLNRIIKYLVYSDLIFYTGWGLISPLFAIFILQSIAGGSVFVVGMSAAVHLITRSLLRVPFGIQADKSQKKAYWYMFWGLLIASFVPAGYIISANPWHIYLLQAVLGSSLAMSTAGWTGVFTKHMDKGKESTEWGVDAVAVGLGPGIAGALGGAAVTYLNFDAVFAAVGIIGIIGALLLLAVKKDILKHSSGSGRLFIPHEIRRLKKARIH